MEIVIHNLTKIIAYIDDLLVYTKDHKKHLEILEQLAKVLLWSSGDQLLGVPANIPRNYSGHQQVQGCGQRQASQQRS